jgi:hypothetical protein
MRDAERDDHFRSNRGGVRSVLQTPEHVLRFSVLSAFVAVVLAMLLLVFGPRQGFWEVFDHLAGTFAVAGLLLAVPALVFARSTDKRVRQSDISDVRHQKLMLRETETGPENEPPLPVEEAIKEVENRRPAIALAGAVRARADEKGITTLLRDVDVLALGNPAGDTSIPGQGTESDLLHFEVEEDEATRVMLPIFTRADALREALHRNPEWEALSILEINGDSLLDHRDRDVTLVLNPWSSFELQLPP